ncbi:uncharacterized protein LOC115244858, partial [Formica exsecta]|uniref:uncharacterized protein LOC115244858 n=1 Tax=Formica exsecta TaxID=72781 RepID=UPI001141A32C
MEYCSNVSEILHAEWVINYHDYSQEQPEESQESILNINEILFEDGSDHVHNEEDLNNNNNEETQLYLSSLTNNMITTTQPISEQTNLQLRSLPFTNVSNINTSSPSRSCSALSSAQSSSDVCDMLQSPSVVYNP